MSLRGPVSKTAGEHFFSEPLVGPRVGVLAVRARRRQLLADLERVVAEPVVDGEGVVPRGRLGRLLVRRFDVPGERRRGRTDDLGAAGSGQEAPPHARVGRRVVERWRVGEDLPRRVVLVVVDQILADEHAAVAGVDVGGEAHWSGTRRSPISTTSYAARAAPCGTGTATSSTPCTAVASTPASAVAIRAAWLADNVAAAGWLASRASDELTCQTSPSRTPTTSIPSRPASRSPNRCRNRTAAPSPIGATLITSSAFAARSVSPSSSRLVATYACAAATGSAGSPVGKRCAGRRQHGRRAELVPAGPARRPRPPWPSGRAVGAARPFRLSLSLTSIGSPGNSSGAFVRPPGAATLPVPMARTSAAAISAAAVPANARGCVRTFLHLLDGSLPSTRHVPKIARLRAFCEVPMGSAVVRPTQRGTDEGSSRRGAAHSRGSGVRSSGLRRCGGCRGGGTGGVRSQPRAVGRWRSIHGVEGRPIQR